MHISNIFSNFARDFVTNTMYTDEYEVQFSDDRKTILSCPEDFKGEYIIPADVTFIDDGAFAGVLGITRVTFVNSDVTIGEDAFS